MVKQLCKTQFNYNLSFKINEGYNKYYWFVLKYKLVIDFNLPQWRVIAAQSFEFWRVSKVGLNFTGTIIVALICKVH